MGDSLADSNVSSEHPDWSRETPHGFWDPGRKLLLSLRRYQYWRAKTGIYPAFMCKLLVLRHRFWSAATGAEFPLTCEIGGGLRIPHPNGIVIHSDAKIGVNCLIFQQVTIGTHGKGVPCIGGHVDIGAGAKILGAIKVGSHVKIGANAVVLNDVPDNATAIGIPAKVIPAR
jgi:serine O-acetyltransferase